ncbi:MAG: hypothetical protein ACPGSO_00630 [Vicingaceae bacterium]
MIDVLICETGNGGDAIRLTSDLKNTSSFSNMVYLAWFGGNPGNPTLGNEIPTEERFDWWGNQLLFNNEVGFQFNSLLEYTLNTTSLNSSGRIIIEESAKKDLEFLSNFANIDVEVSIISDDEVSILARLEEPGNIQDNEFEIIWNSTRKELELNNNNICGCCSEQNIIPIEDKGLFNTQFNTQFN